MEMNGILRPTTHMHTSSSNNNKSSFSPRGRQLGGLICGPRARLPYFPGVWGILMWWLYPAMPHVTLFSCSLALCYSRASFHPSWKHLASACASNSRPGLKFHSAEPWNEHHMSRWRFWITRQYNFFFKKTKQKLELNGTLSHHSATIELFPLISCFPDKITQLHEKGTARSSW